MIPLFVTHGSSEFKRAVHEWQKLVTTTELPLRKITVAQVGPSDSRSTARLAFEFIDGPCFLLKSLGKSPEQEAQFYEVCHTCHRPETMLGPGPRQCAHCHVKDSSFVKASDGQQMVYLGVRGQLHDDEHLQKFEAHVETRFLDYNFTPLEAVLYCSEFRQLIYAAAVQLLALRPSAPTS